MDEDITGQDGLEPTQAEQPAPVAPLYFSRTYDETMSLLHQARNCIVRFNDEPSLSVPARLTFSRETMRLTTRLTSVMAWLLAQRAVLAGEITSQHAASEAHELTARDLCLNEASDDDAALLPAEIRTLMKESLSLYARVARLEDQFRQSA